METLALLHYAIACEDPQLSGQFPEWSRHPCTAFKIYRSIWLCFTGLAAMLSVWTMPSAAIYAALRCGDRGADVVEIQRLLNIPADGIFGSQTQQAVIGFQRQNALEVDGIVGSQTLAALKAIPASQPISFVEDLYFVDLDPAAYTGLNVRQGAGTNFPVINSLPNGTVVAVIAEQPDGNGFPWVKLAGGGWVARAFLSPTSASTTATLSGFYPKINDLDLKNYTGAEYPLATQNALSIYDLVDFFSADNVCYNRGDDYTKVPCVPKAIAQTWLAQQSKLQQQDGKSEGLGVASLLFTENAPEIQQTLQDSRQWLTGHQIDLQNANRLSSGTLTPDWANLIARYTVLQNAQEIADQNRTTRAKSPSEILSLLRSGLQNRRPYTLGIYQNERDSFGNRVQTQGHALTPFAVQDIGQGQTLVRVYDSNFPNTIQTVEFDLNQNTWRYQPPTGREYRGDRNSQNLELTTLFSRTNPLQSKAENPPFNCPFCRTSTDLRISLIGEGGLTVTNDQGQLIQGSVTEPYKGGREKRVPPTYRVPYQNGTRYSIAVSDIQLPATAPVNPTTGKPEGANVAISGPGFIAVFEDIQPAPGVISTITVQGQEDQVELSFAANQLTSRSPKLVFAVDDQVDQQNRTGGYIFEVGRVNLSNNGVFTVGLDTKNKWLYFDSNDDNPNQKTYDVKVTRYSGDPTSPIETYSLTNAPLAQNAGECKVENNQRVNCPRIYMKYSDINSATGEAPFAITTQTQKPQQYTPLKGQVRQQPKSTPARKARSSNSAEKFSP